MDWLTHHRRSEALAARAHELLRQGEQAQAQCQFGLAAEAERMAFDSLDRTKPRTAGIIAVSAVALLFKADQFDAAASLCRQFLQMPALTQAARVQLEELADAIEPRRSLVNSTLGGRIVVRRLARIANGSPIYEGENLNAGSRKYLIKEVEDVDLEVVKKHGRLAHDNVVGVLDVWKLGERNYLQLDFVEGRTLRQEMDAHQGPMDVRRALGMMIQILDGLSAVHHAGILHLDLKPSAILIGRDDRPFITDFGVTRNLAEVSEYSSPEQVEAPHSIDRRSDIFSAGVLLFEMLTGTLPRRSGLANLAQLGSDERTAIKLPAAIQPILAMALQRDRDQRYQDAAEFRNALRSYLRRRRLPGLFVAIIGAITGVARLR